MATKKFKCKVCGYIHEGNKAPDVCPVCKVSASEFELMAEKKKGFSTSSNGYTIVYASVMVILVAALLAFTAQTLKVYQLKNVEIDKKIQILSSMKIVSNASTAEAEYEKYIQEALIVDQQGLTIEGDGFKIDIATEFKKPANERQLPVFVCTMDGVMRYILPVYGAGLWGPIWGFVCMNDDRNTIYGTYFSHKGETPGLGAEIDKPAFQAQFDGKQLFKNGQFMSIAVMKIGQTALMGEDQVDAISGGTITSKGVEAMLLGSIKPYENFLKSGQPVTLPDSALVEVLQ